MPITDYITYIQFAVLILTFLVSAKTWLSIRRRKITFIEGGGEVVIGIDINSKGIKSDIENNFKGKEIAEIIEIPYTLEKEKDFEKAAHRILITLLKNKQKHIHLCIAGPSALAFVIGQFIGYNIYSIQVYHFDNDSRSYIKMPTDIKDWASKLMLKAQAKIDPAKETVSS